MTITQEFIAAMRSGANEYEMAVFSGLSLEHHAAYCVVLNRQRIPWEKIFHTKVKRNTGCTSPLVRVYIKILKHWCYNSRATSLSELRKEFLTFGLNEFNISNYERTFALSSLKFYDRAQKEFIPLFDEEWLCQLTPSSLLYLA